MVDQLNANFKANGCSNLKPFSPPGFIVEPVAGGTDGQRADSG